MASVRAVPQCRVQRSHDVRHLLARWKRVAKAAGLRFDTLCERDGFPIRCLESRRPGSGPAIYLSAGIHGDESGAALGLLLWAEANLDQLASLSVTLMPLLNPWGLRENRRSDGEGTDLNRVFDPGRSRHPLAAAWYQHFKERRFDAAVSLHEDYDGEGVYLYELNRGAFVGKDLLDAVGAVLPRDPRGTIDGRRIDEPGWMRRRRPPAMEGIPEGIALFETVTDLSLTFETPSEADLAVRARAQGVFLDAVIRTLPQSRS